jgi:starvation-inducible DNA-binding protein
VNAASQTTSTSTKPRSSRPVTKKASAATSAGVEPTRRERAEHGFVASAQLAADLQRVHVDLIELHLQGKQAHWNVVGKNFRDLHLQLDEIVEDARQFSDVVAERLRALHAAPDGRSATVAKSTSLSPYPNGEVDTAETVDLITERLEAVVATMRDVHDAVDEEDPTTADILHTMIAALEQYSWMVSAENRVPSRASTSSR